MPNYTITNVSHYSTNCSNLIKIATLSSGNSFCVKESDMIDNGSEQLCEKQKEVQKLHRCMDSGRMSLVNSNSN
jgi:hypothetical protein